MCPGLKITKVPYIRKKQYYTDAEWMSFPERLNAAQKDVILSKGCPYYDKNGNVVLQYTYTLNKKEELSLLVCLVEGEHTKDVKVPCLDDDNQLVCKNETIPILGAYFSKGPRRIEIYMDEIIRSIPEGRIDHEDGVDICEGKKTEFKWLFTQVLVHEFMHALMDVTVYGLSEKIPYDTLYGTMREEMIAEAATLNVLKLFDGDQVTGYYQYAKETIRNKQILAYKMGFHYENVMGNDFYKKVDRHVREKINGVSDPLQRVWCDYVYKAEKAGQISKERLEDFERLIVGEFM